jgi:hypothetical protein
MVLYKNICFLLSISLASVSCLAQFNGAQALDRFIEIEKYMKSIDSTSEYSDIKAQILTFDPMYMEDVQIYNIAIYVLSDHQDSTLYLNLIKAISPNAFGECIDTFTKDGSYCYLKFLKDDFDSLGLKDSPLYQKSLRIFNFKIKELEKTYSPSLHIVCDSLRSEDQKIRMGLISRWTTLSYDSINILMKPQNRIDSSNQLLFDDIIRKHGFPGYDKVNCDLIFLLLQHVENQGKYLPYLEDLAKNHQIYWDGYRAIFYRYYTTPNQEIKPFPFILIDKYGETQVAERSLDLFLEKTSNYWSKKGFTIHYYVANKLIEKELKTILKINDHIVIHTIPTHKNDTTIYYTIEL